MKAADYQKYLKQRLDTIFDEVILEWSISKGASDSMTRNKLLYAPRVDIAIGPFSIKPGHNSEIDIDKISVPLRDLFKGLLPNYNPRCLIAIEVVFSGSSKHILGDIMNASALGVYGIVVGNEDKIGALRRNFEYLKTIQELGKSNFSANNVIILTIDELNDALVP